MTRYAADTTVPADRSRAEIERILSRYGATGFMYGWDQTGAVVGFQADGRLVRFHIKMPNRADFRFTPERGYERSPKAQEEAWEKATRQIWRALALVVKAKLEAIDAGISTFEQEFLAFIQLPDGRTFGEWAKPQLDAAYTEQKMPELLPGAAA